MFDINCAKAQTLYRVKISAAGRGLPPGASRGEAERDATVFST